MSTVHLMRDGSAKGSEEESLGTDDLDCLTVSVRYGQLRIGGSLMQSSVHAGKLQKIVLDASEQVAMISFRGLDVPVEINTAHHGKLSLNPTTGMSILPLMAPKGALAALRIEGGLAVKPTMNVEALFGFLSELRIEDGVIYTSTGLQLEVSHCRALLSRLGAEGVGRADTRMCLQICSQLRIKGAQNSSFFSGMLRRVGWSTSRLNQCVSALEERGYWIRLRRRVSSVCQPIPAMEEPQEKPLRIFPLNGPYQLAMAA